MTKNVTYAEFGIILQELDAHVSVAEAHGILVGTLSSTAPKDANWWKTTILDALGCKPATAKQWAIFTRLERVIDANIKDRFALNLLLPDDEADIEHRVLALADWCRGYLSGLALSGFNSSALHNENIKELVQDLSQIAQADAATAASEEDEKNYAELVEFVRVAVPNIYLELQDQTKQQFLH